MKYDLLEKINFPEDLKKFSLSDLPQICEEIRSKIIEIVSSTGGHLGAGLGVVELSVALHYAFDTPKDLLIFDIGHQSYPHKILTGRKDLLKTLRQEDGISGFTKRKESIYDPFGAGHSSTSISAALGMAVARDLKKEKNEVIAIIGDGAISAGMAYEAMNNSTWLNKRLIVILNDNKMSISPATGGMSNYLARLVASSSYASFRNAAKHVLSYLPKSLEDAARKTEIYAKGIINNGNLFEELGFYYIGPVDGHNLDHLISIFSNIKNNVNINSPILIHVITEKGRGFETKQPCKENFHAVSKFDLSTRIQLKSNNPKQTYTKVFAESLIQAAYKDEKIIAITAAMASGTGLDLFANKFPDRFFDVGIAEQHAVTFAAGLACEGLKPYVAIYSTFLQRAYDQIIHDVVIQKLPVRFAIDRAGFVGPDGPTHAGSFDITFLATLPNIIIMAPSDENELRSAVYTSSFINDFPCAFRYPRGETLSLDLTPVQRFIIGKGKIVQQGEKVAILSVGARLNEAKLAAKSLENFNNIRPTIVDARFIKPLDKELIKNLVENHELLITIEEGAIGGFASHVMNYIYNELKPGVNFKIRTLFFPDYFIEQNNVENMYRNAGLDSESIVNLVKNCL